MPVLTPARRVAAGIAPDSTPRVLPGWDSGAVAHPGGVMPVGMTVATIAVRAVAAEIISGGPYVLPRTRGPGSDDEGWDCDRGAGQLE